LVNDVVIGRELVVHHFWRFFLIHGLARVRIGLRAYPKSSFCHPVGILAGSSTLRITCRGAESTKISAGRRFKVFEQAPGQARVLHPALTRRFA
jgi:hypothetical protein